MDAVIHVGMHKAASTYLQSLLKANKSTLSGSGVLTLTRRGHANLKAIKNKPQPIRSAQAMLTQYVTEFETDKGSPGYGHALVSDEALEFLLSDGFNFSLMEYKLRKMFDRVCYFVIVRDQVGFQASMVQQRVKTFRIYDNQLPAVRTGKPVVIHPLNYLHRFRALLNSDRKTIFTPMHELIKDTGPVVLDRLIQEEFGVNPLSLEDAPVSNSGIGTRGVAFSSFFRYCMLRSLNRKTLPNRLGQRMKKVFLQHCRENSWDKDRYFPFDEDYVARLDNRLARVNADFAEKAWGKTWADVFPVQSHRVSVFDWTTISNEQYAQLQSVFSQFMEAFRSESAKLNLEVRESQFDSSLANYLTDIRGIVT